MQTAAPGLYVTGLCLNHESARKPFVMIFPKLIKLLNINHDVCTCILLICVVTLYLADI